MLKKALQHKRIAALLIAIAFLGAIAAGTVFFGTLKGDNRDKKKIDVEVIGENMDEEKSLAGRLENQAAEEAIRDDAGRLEIKADESESVNSVSVIREPEASMPIAPVSEPTSSLSGDLKIGFVTDIHARSNSNGGGERVLKDFFRDGLDYFIDQMNSKFMPNFLVANGDVIEGTNRSSDIGASELKLIKNIFNRAAAPTYWVIGNHDLRSVTKSQWKKALGIDYLYETFEIGDYKIVILDSNFTGEDKDVAPDTYNTRGRVSEKELAWLDGELGSTDKRIVVFMHHPPLWNVDLKGNGAMPGNTLDIQQVFARHQVLAVFTGHFEDLYINETDGVKYFVLPGFIKNDKYQKTFSEITVHDDEIVVDMTYLKDGKNYRTVRITD